MFQRIVFAGVLMLALVLAGAVGACSLLMDGEEQSTPFAVYFQSPDTPANERPNFRAIPANVLGEREIRMVQSMDDLKAVFADYPAPSIWFDRAAMDAVDAVRLREQRAHGVVIVGLNMSRNELSSIVRHGRGSDWRPGNPATQQGIVGSWGRGNANQFINDSFATARPTQLITWVQAMINQASATP